MPSTVDEIYRVTSKVFPSNTYICRVGVSGNCILIDPGLDLDTIRCELERVQLRPEMVFCTHGHFDHAGSTAIIQEEFDCPVYLHQDDMKVLRASNFLLKAFRIPHKISQPEVSVVAAGFEIQVGGTTLRFHHTPGHTEGSCIIEFGAALFTGDTLYSQGVGLSRLPGENPALLRNSILKSWDLLTEDRTVLPGHGESASGVSVRTNNMPLLRFLGLAIRNTDAQAI